MKILELEQGSDAWLAARANALNASDAPTIMGDGYISLSEHLEIVTGMKQKKVSDYMQGLFDRGHALEAAERPVVEQLYGVTLKPIVATEVVDKLTLQASFDGLDIDNGFLWEHKGWNKYFANYEEGDELKPLYVWQLEHQMMVCGLDKALLTASDDENRIDIVYESDPVKRDELIAGWKSYLKKLVTFERDDAEWVKAAFEYRDAKGKADYYAGLASEAKSHLQELAGVSSASGHGVRVTVDTKLTEKETPASYIKRNKIKLEEKPLDKPKVSYRVTLTKESE